MPSASSIAMAIVVPGNIPVMRFSTESIIRSKEAPDRMARSISAYLEAEPVLTAEMIDRVMALYFTRDF